MSEDSGLGLDCSDKYAARVVLVQASTLQVGLVLPIRPFEFQPAFSEELVVSEDIFRVLRFRGFGFRGLGFSITMYNLKSLKS